MSEQLLTLLQEKCGPENYKKLEVLNNQDILTFISTYVEHCNPDSVFVRTDSTDDITYIRNKAKEKKEESVLNIEGHTVHFDGFKDQGRDKQNTKFLINADLNLGSNLSCIEREPGLDEVKGYLKNSMIGKEMFILFLCLGPVNSEFSLYGVQITDSSYVAHSEDILYRGFP